MAENIPGEIILLFVETDDKDKTRIKNKEKNKKKRSGLMIILNVYVCFLNFFWAQRKRMQTDCFV